MVGSASVQHPRTKFEYLFLPTTLRDYGTATWWLEMKVDDLHPGSWRKTENVVLPFKIKNPSSAVYYGWISSLLSCTSTFMKDHKQVHAWMSSKYE